jgi:hypothetical protein
MVLVTIECYQKLFSQAQGKERALREKLLLLVVVLQEAAAQGDLPRDTFKRLNIALMLQCALSLVVLAQGISVRTPLLVGEYRRTERFWQLIIGPSNVSSHCLHDSLMCGFCGNVAMA